jgi:hypothetical protein
MLKITARQIVAGVGTGLLAGTLAAALELDVQGQICEYNQATEHEDCTTYSLLPFLLIQVFNTLNYYGVAITALATVAIGVFTLTLKLSTDRLWVAGEKQRKLSEDTARRQLRAYVFVAQVEIVDVGTSNVNAAVIIRNTGQTPAYDVTVSTGANAFNIPGNVTFTPTPVGPDSSRFIFGPDGLGRRNISLHSIIGAQTAIAAIKNGNGALYVWGEILYKDAFGEGQHTRFRHMIGGTASWPSDNMMTVCQDGNEAS